ncbi:efflux transporter outer membrane subunit [Sphaerotilus hippei]|nr:efflux transporter outer membrane subunit [Sphaerotilus hippei]
MPPVSRLALLALCLSSLPWLPGCAQSSLRTASAAAVPAAPALPAQWSATPTAVLQATGALEARALGRWWQRFDDALLSTLIEESLQANTDLALAGSRLRQARALRDQQQAVDSPQLGSSASASRSRTRQVGSTSLSAGLDASWEPDFHGAQADRLRGREADVAAAAADLATTRMGLAAEVGLAHVQLRGARLALGIARDNLAAQDETLALMRWRVQAGLASSLDAEQARLSVETLRAALPARESAIAQYEHRIAVLLGRSPEALRPLLGDTSALPIDTSPLPAGVPAEVLRQRPDVRAAEWSLRAEAERLAGTRAERWPSFAITGSLALQAGTLAALTGPGALASAIGAAVSWPLWDAGERRALIEQQQEVLEQARLSYRSVVLTALEDVENALVALGATHRQTEALQQADEAARNALLLAQQRYQAGLIDFGTLLDAQRSALSAADSLASARTDASLNLIRLYKALGGGWSDDQADPTAPTTFTAS